MLDNLLNFITIIAWSLFALMVAYLVFRSFQSGGIRSALRALTTKRVILGFLLAVSLTLLSASLVFIEPQEVGVVVSIISRDGYREDPLRSGLHWIVPLAEKVVPYPIAWQTYTMSAEPLEGSKVGDDAITARTSDGQVVYIDSSVIFRIDGNKVIRLHIDLQNRYIEDFIRPVMRGVIRTEVSQFTAAEVNSSKRKNLESNLDELLRQAFSDKGLILDRFLLRNIAFSEAYSSALEQKQVSEQEQIQAQYEAEKKRKLAEGERDKLKIEAQGQAEAIKLKGQAEADVILLKAQAEAKGLTLISEVIGQNSDLITYSYVDKLSPGIQVMLVPNDNPYLLPLPDLFKQYGVETGNAITTTITDTLTSTMPLPLPTFTPTPTLSP
jgi:regulator of protease activity HflC (stomatin/prohibitin superfamily)